MGVVGIRVGRPSHAEPSSASCHVTVVPPPTPPTVTTILRSELGTQIKQHLHRPRRCAQRWRESPLWTLSTELRGNGRHRPRWTPGAWSSMPPAAEVTGRSKRHSNQGCLDTGHPLPVHPHGASPMGIQSGQLCPWVHTCCFIPGRHKTLLTAHLGEGDQGWGRCSADGSHP